MLFSVGWNFDKGHPQLGRFIQKFTIFDQYLTLS